MTIESETEREPPKKKPGEARRSAIEGAYHALSREGSQGDAAALRRMRVERHEPLPPAFWKYLATYAEPLLNADLASEQRDWQELRWAVAFRTAAQLRGQHRASARVGGALADAGVQEPRVLRLLRARGESLFDQLRVLAHQLASKAVDVDVAGLIELLFHEDDERAEVIRRQIARDFYSKTARTEE